MQSNRNITVDIARTIAMLGIVIGHLGVGPLVRYVFPFNVTMFYLVSGYFTRPGNDFRKFLNHKIRTLIAPYFISCVSILPFWLLRSTTQYAKGSVQSQFLYWISATCYGAGFSAASYIKSIGSIWFLWAMFWASLIFYGLLKCHPYVRLVAVFSLFWLSILSTKYIWLPLSIQSSGAGLLFIYIGYLYRQVETEIRKLPKEQKYASYVIMGWLCGSFILNFQSFWLVSDDVGRGITDILGSISSCSLILIFCSYFAKTQNNIILGFGYFGKYTIMMFFLHFFEDSTGILRFVARRIAHSTSSGTFYLLKFIFEMIWIFVGTYLLSKISKVRKFFGLKE